MPDDALSYSGKGLEKMSRKGSGCVGKVLFLAISLPLCSSYPSRGLDTEGWVGSVRTQCSSNAIFSACCAQNKCTLQFRWVRVNGTFKIWPIHYRMGGWQWSINWKDLEGNGSFVEMTRRPVKKPKSGMDGFRDSNPLTSEYGHKARVILWHTKIILPFQFHSLRATTASYRDSFIFYQR